MLQRLLPLLLFSVALLPAEVPSLVAIQDARIVTVSGPILEKGTIVLKDGIIADVGPSASIPKGAWIIDGKGLTVYPGLIDAFSTWGIPDAVPAAPPVPRQPAAPPAPAAPQSQQPRSRGPGDRPGTESWILAADLVRITDHRIEQARGAGFTTAVTFPRKGLIAGHGAVIDLGGETAGQMVVDPDAGLYMNTTPFGYTGYPNSLMGVIAYFRQLWLDAAYYQTAQLAYSSAPDRVPRPAYDRALAGVLTARRLLLPTPGPVQLDRMLALSAELGTPAVFWGAVEGYRMAATLKKSGRPVILDVKWPTRSKDADPEVVDPLRVLEIRDKAPTSPAVLAAAGVRFAVSSDGLDAPKDVLKALKNSIDIGLKKEDALRALTLSAAEIYGLNARLGSLDRGKIANLFVTDGDLFDEKTKVRMTFVDGIKYVPSPELPPGSSHQPRENPEEAR